MIECALTRCDAEQIDLIHLQTTNPDKIHRDHPTINHDAVSLIHPNRLEPASSSAIPEEGLQLFLLRVEREILLNTLSITRWNRTLAAKKLRMSFRSLRYRLKKLGLDHE